MITLPTEEAEALRQSEMDHSITFALAFGILTVIATLATALFGWVFALPFVGYLTLIMFLIGGMAVGFVLLTGLRRGRWIIRRVVEIAEDWIDAEISAKQRATALPTPTLPSTLPLENRMIPVSTGDRVVDLPLDLIHGFDPRDLMFLCRQVARRNYTEEGMEKLELPYSHDVMGKAQPGTRYTLFMELCVTAGIIEGRAPKKSGTLAVTDPDEMMRRIRQVE